MLETSDKKARWSGVESIIERWLQERQSLIVQYCGVSGVLQFSPRSTQSSMRLQKFCQLLVDYVSAGHFEIYYQLVREAEEFNDDGVATANRILPAISNSTEVALGFNDHFGNPGDITENQQLPAELSALGETLAARFELEDELIDVLHNAHREQLA